MTSPTKQRRGDIQGMRALAVGLVIVAHAGFSQFPGGFVGVDVFFVLSGFLITGLLVAEADRTGTVSIAGFYARRARRILPAATLTLVAILIWAVLREPWSQFAATAKDSLWSAVFLSNVHFAGINTDYFSEEAVSPVRHFWSLSVEEQFYVVWPLLILLLLVLKARRRVLVIVMSAVVVLSLAWSIYLTGTDPQAAYFSTPARAHELGLGALLALLTPVLTSMGDRLRHLLAIVGLALIALATFGFDEATAFPSYHALIPVLGTVALLAAGTGREVGLSTLLGRQPLRYLGDLSFSLYLWHWPILIFGRPYVEDWGLRGTFVLLALTLLASMASYHFVEQPFQKGTVPSLRGRRYLVLWPVSLALVAGTAFGAQQYGEHEQEQAKQAAAEYYQKNPEASAAASSKQIPQQVQAALKLADSGAPVPPDVSWGRGLPADMRWEGNKCYASDPETKHARCELGDTASNKTMVLLGDSHAGMWLPAMHKIAKQQGYRLVPILKMGCAPYDVSQHLKGGKAFPECATFRDWSRAQVLDLKPSVLVLGHRGMLFVDGGALENQKQRWQAGVERTIADYTKLVPEVRVLADIPANGMSPKSCLTAPEATLASCLFAQDGLEMEADKLTKQVVAASSAEWVNTIELVCHAKRCPMVVGSTVTYRDDSHVSGPWVRNVAEALGKRLDLPAAAL